MITILIIFTPSTQLLDCSSLRSLLRAFLNPAQSCQDSSNSEVEYLITDDYYKTTVFHFVQTVKAWFSP